MDHSPYMESPWNQYTSGLLCDLFDGKSKGRYNDTKPNPDYLLKSKSISNQTADNLLKSLFQQWSLMRTEEDTKNNIDFTDKRIARIMEPANQYWEIPWAFPTNWLPVRRNTLTHPYIRSYNNYNNLSVYPVHNKQLNLVPDSHDLNVPSSGYTPWASLYSLGFSPSFSPERSPGFFSRAEKSILTPPSHTMSATFRYQPPFTLHKFQYSVVPLDETLIQPPYIPQYGPRVPIPNGYVPSRPRYHLNGNYAYPNAHPNNIYGVRPRIPPWYGSNHYGLIHTPQFQSELYGTTPFLSKVPFLPDRGWTPLNNLGVSNFEFYPGNGLSSVRSTYPMTPVDEARNVYFSDTNVFIPLPTNNWACTEGVGYVVWDMGIPRTITPIVGVPVLRSGSGAGSGATSGTGFGAGSGTRVSTRTVKPSISMVPGHDIGGFVLNPQFPNSKHIFRITKYIFQGAC